MTAFLKFTVFAIITALLSFSTVRAFEPQTAKQSLEQAAIAEDVCAMFDLGTLYLMYPDLSGTPTEEAYRWYRAAAEKGHLQAQQNLCEMYFYGVGKIHDFDQAMRWCTSASLDQKDTNDGNFVDRRVGASWKSDLLAKTNPKTKASIHDHTTRHQGTEIELPTIIGGINPSAWACKSIFDDN